MDIDAAQYELSRIGSILRRCMEYLDQAGTAVEFSDTGYSVQRILDNMCTRLTLLEDRLPVHSISKVTLQDEEFYKLGVMFTKMIQLAYKQGIVKEVELSDETFAAYN